MNINSNNLDYGGHARLSRADVARLAAAGHEVEVPAGQMLIERGQHGSGLYVILAGSIIVEAAQGRTHELGPGSYVGDLALLSRDGRRTARVRARTDVRAAAVPRSTFEDLHAGDPQLRERGAPVRID